MYKLKNMTTAGYSGTPLLKKLGIRPETKILLVNQPDDYYDMLEADLNNQLCSSRETPDLIHLFVKSNKEFETGMKKLKKFWERNPAIVLWVSWYKKSAGIPTDLTEDMIRNYALKNDLVDIKVCAVNDQWSGLKLVVQKEKRG